MRLSPPGTHFTAESTEAMRIKSLAQGENILMLGIEPSTFVSKIDILTTTPIVHNQTELMFITSNRTKHLHSQPTSITISNAQVPFKQSVNNLGFTLDCHHTMNAHVSNIAQACYFELHHLASIHEFLTSTATAKFVSAFVLSRIDYFNSLLFGSTRDATFHLQRI